MYSLENLPFQTSVRLGGMFDVIFGEITGQTDYDLDSKLTGLFQCFCVTQSYTFQNILSFIFLKLYSDSDHCLTVARGRSYR